MKFLTSIDLTAQTILMSSALVPGILGIFLEDVLLVSMLSALVLGPWQLIGAIASTWAKRVFLEQRKLYLKLTAVYFVFIGIGAALADIVTDNVPVIIFVVIAVAAPIALAIFYYVITYKTYRSTKIQLV